MKSIKYFAFFLACALMAGCSGSSSSVDPDHTPTPSPTPTPSDTTSQKTDPTTSDLDNFVAPTYEDNYTSISDWSKRSQWNLANVHDPTVMKAADGYYYMYQTDASYGNAHTNHGHFHGRRSKNLVDWEYLGSTMTNAPAWVKDSLNSIRKRQGLDAITSPNYGYWAPCARKVSDNLYRMYYAIVVDNYIKTGKANTDANFDGSWTERAFIGMMETTDPSTNKWTDKGYVICSASDKGKSDWKRVSGNWDGYYKFNCIDPSFIITPEGEHWLIYGSWHSGIAAIQLDPSTGKTKDKLGEPWDIGTGTDTRYGKLIFTRTKDNRWQGSEAPEVVYHDGYYYLFMAYDALAVPYNTRVLRSKSITGPYVTMDGTVTDASQGANDNPTVLTHPYKFSQGYGWVGISHCCVFDDGNGNWYYASQQRFPENVSGINASNALMMGGVRSIKWMSNGWPAVMPERYSAVPTVAITDAQMAGTYEFINLKYQYGVQQTSTEMVLGTNHTVTSGDWKGQAWSFDATKNILTIGTHELMVQRETDWEASPRKATIVFSGAEGSVSYWGKKTK